MSEDIGPLGCIGPVGSIDAGVELRLREALRRGRELRVPGGSRGVSYAPQDLAARLRRVDALRRLCLDLRRAAALSGAPARVDELGGGPRPPRD